jgi:hypothetical protein
MKKFKKRVIAAVVAVMSLATFTISASAYTIEKGIYGVTDMNGITIPDGSDIELGGDESGDNASPYAYVMNIPGTGPVSAEATAETALEQNAALWSAIDTVSVDFSVANQSGADVDPSAFYVMGNMELGADASFAKFDSSNNPEFVSITPDITAETPFAFGSVYTLTFHPKAAMTNAAVANTGKGGVMRMDLILGNDDVNPMKVDIKFDNVTVTGDQTAITKYTELAKELTANETSEYQIHGGSNDVVAPSAGGTTAAAGAGGATTTAAGGTTAVPQGDKSTLPQGDKASANTGAADIAVIIGVAVAAGAAIAITSKKKNIRK